MVLENICSLSNAMESTYDRTQPAKQSSHCKLLRNDIVGGYQIEKPLGKGRFSTVWGAKKVGGYDNNGCYNNTSVAIKVYRRGGNNEDFFSNEIGILTRINKYAEETQTEPTNLIKYLGTIAHISMTNGPKIHPCVIFEWAGESLSSLLKFCILEYKKGIPVHIVKKIMRDVLSGLSYLHKCEIIHTDIKPSNVLLGSNVEDLDADNMKIVIADLGSSTFTNDLFSIHVGTTEYLAPELILEQDYGTPMDIWASFIMCYELITGDLLFDVFGECEVTYGEDVDCVMLDLSEDTDLAEEQEHTENTENNITDSSDSSGEEEDETKVAYRHLLLIAKVLGYPPSEFCRNARDYYNRRNKLMDNPDIIMLPISELLYSNYQMEIEDCKQIEEFLLCGLKYMPDERITADGALAHEWLIK